MDKYLLNTVNKFDKLRDDSNRALAAAFLEAGAKLLPNPYLSNNTFIVSQEIYDAAKKVAEERTRLGTGF